MYPERGAVDLRNDEELALDIQQGSRADLATLVERHHGPLMGFLYRMTSGNRVLAEDLVQETFLRMMRSIHQYQYPRPFKPWLYMIATNLTRDHYKRAETRYVVGIPESDEVQLIAEASPKPEETLLLNAEVKAVATALQMLPIHQREAVILRYYQEFSLNEVAEALGIPVGTVKSRLSLGLERLREMLTEREK